MFSRISFVRFTILLYMLLLWRRRWREHGKTRESTALQVAGGTESRAQRTAALSLQALQSLKEVGAMAEVAPGDGGNRKADLSMHLISKDQFLGMIVS